ncbi:MAG: hypothetical protein R6V35_02290 [Candidatus Nanohaloarchaea archaeon]
MESQFNDDLFKYWERLNRRYSQIASTGKYGSEALTEGSPMMKVLGNHPKSRAVEALLTNKGQNLREDELCRYAGLDSKEALKLPEFAEDWEEYGVISRIIDRESGEINYSLNTHSQAVNDLGKAGFSLSRWSVEE